MNIWQHCGLNLKGVGGVEVTVSMLHDQFTKLGHQVHTGLSRPPFNTQIILTHGDVYFKGFFKRPGTTWFHVFHGTTAARMLACKEYFSPSGYKGLVRELTLAAGCDQAIAVSPHVESEVLSLYWLKKPVSLIPNGVDDFAFKPLTSISSSPLFAFVGRSTDRVKNFSSIVEAFDGVASVNPMVRLLAIPGSTNFKRPYLSNVGIARPQELREQLEKCRALILFSSYEGDPLVVREAMSLGLPIIASKIPGVMDCTDGYPNLFPVEPTNVSDLKEKILMVTKANLTPSPRARSWNIVAKEYITLFEEGRAKSPEPRQPDFPTKTS